IAELPCKLLHLRQEALVVVTPAKRSLKAPRHSPIGTHGRVLEKEVVVTKPSSRRTKTGIRRPLGMLHFGDCIAICSYAQPFRNLLKATIWVSQQAFSLNPLFLMVGN